MDNGKGKNKDDSHIYDFFLICLGIILFIFSILIYLNVFNFIHIYIFSFNLYIYLIILSLIFIILGGLMFNIKEKQIKNQKTIESSETDQKTEKKKKNEKNEKNDITFMKSGKKTKLKIALFGTVAAGKGVWLWTLIYESLMIRPDFRVIPMDEKLYLATMAKYIRGELKQPPHTTMGERNEAGALIDYKDYSFILKFIDRSGEAFNDYLSNILDEVKREEFPYKDLKGSIENQSVEEASVSQLKNAKTEIDSILKESDAIIYLIPSDVINNPEIAGHWYTLLLRILQHEHILDSKKEFITENIRKKIKKPIAVVFTKIDKYPDILQKYRNPKEMVTDPSSHLEMLRNFLGAGDKNANLDRFKNLQVFWCSTYHDITNIRKLLLDRQNNELYGKIKYPDSTEIPKSQNVLEKPPAAADRHPTMVIDPFIFIVEKLLK